MPETDNNSPLLSGNHFIHGMSGNGPFHNPTYNSWRGMLERCRNPNHIGFGKYGGSGIKVCERWLTFTNFLNDMGICPAGCSLDRYPNRNGDYEKENCRWATDVQQANNKDFNVRLTYSGMTMTLAEWAKHLGMNYWTIQARYKRHLPIDKILSPILFKCGRK